jgi:hypothetical protein
LQSLIFIPARLFNKKLLECRRTGMENKNETNPPPRYTWPWFVLGFAVLGVALAILWMTVLVRRTREQREYQAWPVPTHPILPTNSTPRTNSDSVHGAR